MCYSGGCKKAMVLMLEHNLQSIIFFGILLLIIPQFQMVGDSSDDMYLLVDTFDVGNIVDEHYHDYMVYRSPTPEWRTDLSYPDGYALTDDGRVFTEFEQFFFYAPAERDVMIVKRAAMSCDLVKFQYFIGDHKGEWEYGGSDDCNRSWGDARLFVPSIAIRSDHSDILLETDTDVYRANSYYFWVYSKISTFEYFAYVILLGIKYLLAILLVFLVLYRLYSSRAALRLYLNANIGTLALWVTIFILVTFAYYWFITLGTWDISSNTYRLKLDGLSAYGTLAEALLAGQLNVLTGPHPIAYRVTDPYDQFSNLSNIPDKFDLFDFSYYDGKYFLCHSPVPTLLFYIPSIVLFKTDIRDAWVVLFFLLGTYVFTSLTILHIQKKCFPDMSQIALVCAYLVAGFGNCASFQLQRTDMYEVAISCGVFFFVGALYWLFTSSLAQSRGNYLRYFLCGLFLGLSVWSRPTYGLGAVMLICVTAIYLLVSGSGLKRTSKRMIYLLLPFMICVILFTTYNYLRFDDPFEFGIRYQLTGFNSYKMFTPSLSHMVRWTYFHFLRTPRFSDEFPFIHLSNQFHPSLYITPDSQYFILLTLPLHIISPYILILGYLFLKGIWSVCMVMLSQIRGNSLKKQAIIRLGSDGLYLKFVVLTLISATFGTMFSFSIIPIVTFRYLMDYAPLMILLSSVSWFIAIESLNANKRLLIFRYPLLGLMIVLTLITMVLNILMYFNGPNLDHRLTSINSLREIIGLI